MATHPSGAAPKLTARRTVVEADVSFSIINKNDSRAPCQSDGGAYTVRGWLRAPRALLDAQDPGITIYLHGASNARTWHLTSVRGYDHIAEMAKLGHASLFIDQLGYGDSSTPDGMTICLGSLADIAAQIAEHLRGGSYASSGVAPRRFARVALAGHSMGGHIAEAAASSFPGSFDAVIITGWGAVAQARLIPVSVGVANLAADCTVSPADKNGSPGYAFGLKPEEIETALFYNGDPDVIAVAARGWEPDACGIHRSQGLGLTLSPVEAAAATMPVLVVLGDHDLFTAPDLYASRFSGSGDVSWFVVPDSGHMMMLERSASAFRDVLHRWLRARQL